MVGYTYILANRKHGTLYIGVTNDLVRRVDEHRRATVSGFTSKYGTRMLVYFEQHETGPLAITREKQLKKWKRDWKIRLIEQENPEWSDLFDGISA